MSIVDQLRREIGINIRALCTGTPGQRGWNGRDIETLGKMEIADVPPLVRDTRVARRIRRILRIEVDYDGRDALFSEYYRYSDPYKGGPFDTERVGPLTFEGVDLYLVEKLPAPGWRVINPFVPTKP